MHLYYLLEAIYTLVAGFKARLMYWRQKLRLVGVGVSRLREIDDRQMLITDFV